LNRCLCPDGMASWNKYGRHNAKQADHCGKNPGTSFQNIISLFYAHELVAETGNIACESATFWILNKNDKTQYNGSKGDQDYENYGHFKVFLNGQFWRQSKPFSRDSANLICGIILSLSLYFPASAIPLPWLR
jgi:hypothetical protein